MEVIIHSMSKTATTSLKQSFLKLTDNVAQIHMLNGRPQLKSYVKENMVEYINKNKNKKFLIINVFRCPIQRKLSLYFYKKRKEKIKDSDILKKNINEYILSKDNEFILNKNENDLFFDYCDHPNYEWNKFFGFNYYDKPFNFIDKYNVHIKNNLIFLNLRFDDIILWNIIINNFLKKYNLFNNKKFNLLKNSKTTINILNDKIQKKYKNNIILSKVDFNKIYNYSKKDLEYFYTKKELENWKKRYCSNN
jgi:hypothetical protein